MVEWIDRWAADAARRGLDDRYIRQQKARVRALAAFCRTRGIITQDQVRAWLADLQANGLPRTGSGKQRPCSAKTLNNHLSGLHQFFEWCRESRLTDTNPAAGIQYAKMKQAKGRVFTGDQAWAIFFAAEDDEAARRPRCRDQYGIVVTRSPFYRVLIATGMRAGAAAALRVRDFELTAEPPRIVLRAEHDKSGKEREIVISGDDREYFYRTLEGRRPGELAVTRPHPRVLAFDAQAAGVPVKDDRGRGVGFHCFRRWHGTELDRQGFSIEVIRQRLGHRDIRTTAGYLVRQLEEQQGVAETLAKISRKSVDLGNRIPDDLRAETDTHSPSQSPEIHRVSLAPVGLSNRRREAPRVFPQRQSPGRDATQGTRRGQDSGSDPDPPPKRETGSNPVTPISAASGDLIRLFHRFLDLIESPDPPMQGSQDESSGVPSSDR